MGTVLRFTKEQHGANPPADHQVQALQDLLKPHVESFNDMLDTLPLMVANLQPGYFEIEGNLITIAITSASIAKPQHVRTPSAADLTLYPSECRARATTYSATLHVTYKITSGPTTITLDRNTARVPIMLKSNRCNLRGMTPLQLIQHQEEPEVCCVNRKTYLDYYLTVVSHV